MLQTPFKIPDSLQSYVVLYGKDPAQAIKKLIQRLKKRGFDAIGSMLLACMYGEKGENDQALEYAHKARILSPGSQFFKKLPYFLLHPQKFDAWSGNAQDAVHHEHSKSSKGHGLGVSSLELDELIDALSDVENTRISLSKPTETITPSEDADFDLSKDVNDVDDIYTETLANIYVSQKQYHKAIDIYRKLAIQDPEKKTTYDAKIREVNSMIDEN